MKNPFALTIFLNALLLCQSYLVASSDTIVEGETSLPLAYDVDVLVAGGSLAGVEAACVASDKGASVLVIESRPYLGYDICANQKLWLEPGEKPQTDITRWIFDGKRQQTPYEGQGPLGPGVVKKKYSISDR
jgi:hypothetical protein